jgi:hypothetical protein
MSDNEADGATAESLEERIDRQMVVDVPDEAELVRAIGEAVNIVSGSWKLQPTDALEEREREDQVLTYLLAAYAANVVSHGERPATATRQELSDMFGNKLAQEIAWHAHVDTVENYAEVRPESLVSLTKELSRRYGGDDDE